MTTVPLSQQDLVWTSIARQTAELRRQRGVLSLHHYTVSMRRAYQLGT